MGFFVCLRILYEELKWLVQHQETGSRRQVDKVLYKDVSGRGSLIGVLIIGVYSFKSA